MGLFMGVLSDPFGNGVAERRCWRCGRLCGRRAVPAPMPQEADRRLRDGHESAAADAGAALECLGRRLRRLAIHGRQRRSSAPATRPVACWAPPSALITGFRPNTQVGFALAGGGTNFSVANSLGAGRSDLFQAGVYLPSLQRAGLPRLGSTRLWLAGHHHRPHGHHRRRRSPPRRVQRQRLFGPRSKAAIAWSVPWIGGIGITPYAAAPGHDLRSAGLCRAGRSPARPRSP